MDKKCLRDYINLLLVSQRGIGHQNFTSFYLHLSVRILLIKFTLPSFYCSFLSVNFHFNVVYSFPIPYPLCLCTLFLHSLWIPFFLFPFLKFQTSIETVSSVRRSVFVKKSFKNGKKKTTTTRDRWN